MKLTWDMVQQIDENTAQSCSLLVKFQMWLTLRMAFKKPFWVSILGKAEPQCHRLDLQDIFWFFICTVLQKLSNFFGWWSSLYFFAYSLLWLCYCPIKKKKNTEYPIASAIEMKDKKIKRWKMKTFTQRCLNDELEWWPKLLRSLHCQ